jgi:hypothetical protein
MRHATRRNRNLITINIYENFHLTVWMPTEMSSVESKRVKPTPEDFIVHQRHATADDVGVVIDVGSVEYIIINIT